VIVAQPHVIILPDEDSKNPMPILDWHKWPEIPAVKNNKFINVDADLLHRFSTRMLNGIEDMCEKIDQHR
jgi:vitamin B12 transport system substrate-binding protein